VKGIASINGAAGINYYCLPRVGGIELTQVEEKFTKKATIEFPIFLELNFYKK